MECQMNWGERNLVDWIVHMPALPRQPPIITPYPLTLLPWQLTPALSVEIRDSKCVWTHVHGSIVWFLWWLCCCGNGSCAIVMNPKTISPGILLAPSHCFVTVCSLSFHPPLLPPHCFLSFIPFYLTHCSPAVQIHTDLQQEGDLYNWVDW